jgi:hypothetical protein
MDELPDEARALLERARSWEVPPDGARARVRRNVALVVTGAAAGSTASQTSAQWSAFKGALWTGAAAKLRLLACVAVLAGGGALLLRQSASGTAASRKPAPTQLSVPQPSAAPTLASDSTPSSDTEAAPAPAEAAVRVQQQRVEPKTSKRLDADSHTHLGAEMALLHEVSQALNQHELTRARSLLREHQARFAHGQLRAEREGLGVLAQCMAHAPHASEQARNYLRRAPDGVLAARIEGACAPKAQP